MVTEAKLKSLELLACRASPAPLGSAGYRDAQSGGLLLLIGHSLGPDTVRFWRTGFWRQEVAGN